MSSKTNKLVTSATRNFTERFGAGAQEVEVPTITLNDLLVCIEAHPEVRQPILEYFARGGYVIVGKYLRADTHNLYFQPAQ
jgi:hypothetical protein